MLLHEFLTSYFSALKGLFQYLEFFSAIHCYGLHPNRNTSSKKMPPVFLRYRKVVWYSSSSVQYPGQETV